MQRVVRVRGTNKGLAMTTDCNSRYIYLDPETGGKIAVAEAARNIVCSGAEPLAITDCLNFGNPEKPEIFWQFEKSADGISAACLALKCTSYRRERFTYIMNVTVLQFIQHQQLVWLDLLKIYHM